MKATEIKAAAKSAPPVKEKAKKLSYMEQREWDGIEEKVTAVETALAEAQAKLGDPAVMADRQKMSAASTAAAVAQKAVDKMYARWQEAGSETRMRGGK